MKSSSRSFVPILVVCGAVIGGVLTYLVFSSVSYLGKEGALKASVNSSVPVPSERSMDGTMGERNPSVYSDKHEELEVAWHDPKFLTDSEVMDFFGVQTSSVSSTEGEYHEISFKRMWRAGLVRGGDYDGEEVYVINYEVGGMGVNDYFQHLIRDRNGRIYAIHDKPVYGESLWLEKAHQDIDLKNTLMPNVTIPALSVPEEFVLNGGKMYRINDGPFAWNDVYRFDLDATVLRKVGTVDGFDVFIYESKNYKESCLYVFSPDGFTYRFTSHIEFKRDDSGNVDPQRPDVVWNDPTADSGPYEYRALGGCGAWGCSNVVAEEDVIPNSLIEAGRSKDGSSIFVPKDPSSHPIVQKQYSEYWYDPGSFEDGKKPAMEVFLSRVKTPVFFWKDALGRWVQYTSVHAVGMVECGKPVIYLYPETQTDVRVALPKFINVTVSEPAYPKKGWSVTAKPNGDLISKADGKTYGSLYWEGTGVGYQPPTTGFVVSKYSVTTTLSNILAKYGLNQKESFEFMNFWIPKFAETNAPYFRISFLTNEWSKAAPLSVTPVPKTSIRIFMDWQPLSAPISIPEPQITTPQRNGFTLVEWGGTLYK